LYFAYILFHVLELKEEESLIIYILLLLNVLINIEKEKPKIILHVDLVTNGAENLFFKDTKLIFNDDQFVHLHDSITCVSLLRFL
jgi:hypothetical protein